MEITEKDVKRIFILFLLLILAILVFLVVKPVVISVIAGLLLAYVFFPVYKKIQIVIKSKNISAGLLSLFVVLLILVPLWFLAPLMIQQIFDLFQDSGNLAIESYVAKIFPTASENLISQISLTTQNAISKISSLILNSFIEILVNFATLLLHFILIFFIFFFTLRDYETLQEFVSGISPLSKRHEKALIKQFEDITHTIIHGQIIIGLVQGITAGIGFYLFGVQNALVLTLLSIIIGIIPVLGLGLVYIPITIYLLATGSPLTAVGFLIYNLLVVSLIDNVLRLYLISRKTQLSQVIVLVGMVGGTLIFGLIGLVIGPLILAYFITFLKAYKEKILSEFFSSG